MSIYFKPFILIANFSLFSVSAWAVPPGHPYEHVDPVMITEEDVRRDRGLLWLRPDLDPFVKRDAKGFILPRPPKSRLLDTNVTDFASAKKALHLPMKRHYYDETITVPIAADGDKPAYEAITCHAVLTAIRAGRVIDQELYEPRWSIYGKYTAGGQAPILECAMIELFASAKPAKHTTIPHDDYAWGLNGLGFFPAIIMGNWWDTINRRDECEYYQELIEKNKRGESVFATWGIGRYPRDQELITADRGEYWGLLEDMNDADELEMEINGKVLSELEVFIIDPVMIADFNGDGWEEWVLATYYVKIENLAGSTLFALSRTGDNQTALAVGGEPIDPAFIEEFSLGRMGHNKCGGPPPWEWFN